VRRGFTGGAVRGMGAPTDLDLAAVSPVDGVAVEQVDDTNPRRLSQPPRSTPGRWARNNANRSAPRISWRSARPPARPGFSPPVGGGRVLGTACRLRPSLLRLSRRRRRPARGARSWSLPCSRRGPARVPPPGAWRRARGDDRPGKRRRRRCWSISASRPSVRSTCWRLD